MEPWFQKSSWRKPEHQSCWENLIKKSNSSTFDWNCDFGNLTEENPQENMMTSEKVLYRNHFHLQSTEKVTFQPSMKITSRQRHIYGSRWTLKLRTITKRTTDTLTWITGLADTWSESYPEVSASYALNCPTPNLILYNNFIIYIQNAINTLKYQD